MGRRRKVRTCGHSTSVRGAADLVALVESVLGVHRVSNGRINRVVRGDFRGVKVIRNSYCIQITLFADNGTQHFSAVPVNHDQLSDLYCRIVKSIRRKYRIWGDEEDVMARRTKQEREDFLRKIYDSLLDISEEINGIRVVKDIRAHLRSEFGLSESELNGIQADKSLLIPVGNERPAVYRLITPKGYETVEGETETEQVVVEVTEEVRIEVGQGDEQVSIPIPPEMLKLALEALWTEGEQGIRLLEEEGKVLLAEAESLRARIAEIDSKLQINSEQVKSRSDQNNEVIAHLDRLR